MKIQDYLVYLILSGIAFTGIYQFYFFVQHHQIFKVRTFHSRLDEKIPFWPAWSWLYSFLYYPAVLYLIWTVRDARQFSYIVFSYVILMFMQMIFFWVFPVSTPPHWRSVNQGRTASERFLKFIQKYDAPTNCFPSMHTSVATLTAFHALGSLGPWAFAFPVLIALSCLFTKQHYMINLPFGAALGWVAFRIYAGMM